MLAPDCDSEPSVAIEADRKDRTLRMQFACHSHVENFAAQLEVATDIGVEDVDGLKHENPLEFECE